jgi:hypothetical protein
LKAIEMMRSKRDLLVLSKKAVDDPQNLKQEVELLDSILYIIETTKNLCTCIEVIDVNRYKIIQKPSLLEKLVDKNELKPFQFIFNKN